MKNKRIRISSALRLFALLIIVYCSNIANAQQLDIIDVKTKSQWDSVFVKAYNNKTIVFVDYYSQFCGVCTEMDERLFKDSFFVQLVKDQILFAKVDIESELGIRLVEHYSVDNIPTVLILNWNSNIITDSIAPDSFILREKGRGKGIETYNLQNGTNYGNAVDFVDDDNYWNNYNAAKDEIATDAHWGTEMTYDFYFNNFGRNSIDDNGFKLRSYLHYSNNYSNAFWNGQWMTYGDGNASSNPFLSIDIIGHEISHGLTTFTANLIYASQSGAINEGFSDVFGNMIERYAKPTAYSWELGEDIGYVLRDMSNPNSKGDPDTYEGSYWIDTENCVPDNNNDNCGVHTNSSVLNFWFLMLQNL